MKYISLIIVLTILTFSSYSIAYGSLVEAPPISLIPKKIITEKDEKIGRYLTEIHRNLLRYRPIDTSIIKNLKASINKESPFFAFNKLLPILINLDLKNNNKTLNNCLRNLSLTMDENILDLFQKNINRYCIRKLTRIKDNSFLVNKNLPLFIKENIELLLGRFHIRSFTKWIKGLAKESFLHNQLSQIISDYYSNSKTMPKSALLKEIIMTKKLGFLVQDGNINKDEGSKLFKKEIQEISRKFRVYLKKGKKKESIDLLNKTITFYEGNLNLIKPSYAIKKILNMSRHLILDDNIQESVKILKRLHKVSLSGQKNKVLFQIIWAYLIKEDFKSIRLFAKDYKLLNKFDKLPEKIRFWISYSFKKNNESTKAFEYYQKLIDSSPLSFYSILAQREMKFQKLPKNTERRNQEISFHSKTLSIEKILENPKLKSLVTRILIWSKVSNQTFLKKDINQLLSLKSEVFIKADLTGVDPVIIKRELIYFLAQNFNKNNQFLYTFKLIQNSISNKIIGLNSYSLKFLFPFQYISKIKKIDESIDPLIILSLIRQESAFNPRAKSVVGARGLMQLMPATARMFKRSVSISQLKTPQINLNIGMKHLKNLVTKYEGNLVFALAAYNAGESRLNRWIEKAFTSENPLIVIESIPFKETRNYVKLIYRNIFFYKILTNSYGKIPIEESFTIAYNFN